MELLVNGNSPAPTFVCGVCGAAVYTAISVREGGPGLCAICWFIEELPDQELRARVREALGEMPK
jgi:hypothetical protein